MLFIPKQNELPKVEALEQCQSIWLLLNYGIIIRWVLSIDQLLQLELPVSANWPFQRIHLK